MIASPTLPQDTHCITFYSLTAIFITFNLLEVISGSFDLLDLHIERLNSSSVRLSVDLDRTLVFMGNTGLLNSSIKVSYQLSDPEMIPDPCKNKDPDRVFVPIPAKMYSRYIEICKNKVFMFGGFNDTIGTNYTHMTEYCKPNDIYLKKIGEFDLKPQIITNLLPRQRYSFQVEINHIISNDPIGINEKHRAICMKDSAPLYPPQTDFGSFRYTLASKDIIKDNSSLKNYRIVDIYFRPVPAVISNYENLNYTIQCFDQDKILIHDQNITDAFTGRTEVCVSMDSSYTCALWSRNLLGRSINSSMVTIPPQGSIINTRGKFNLYVSAVTSNGYLLRWTDMDELLKKDEEISREVKSLLPNATGSYTRAYTIYWCMMRPDKICSNIEGMVKTGKTELAIEIPGDHGIVFNRIFGISYRSIGNKLFTGILWSACVGTVKTEAQSMNNALKMHHNGIADEKSISIGWNVDGCKGITSLIKEYEINYCILATIDPCGSIEPPSIIRDSWDWSHTSCSTHAFSNNLTFDTRILNLNSSTTYKVRIRASIEGRSWNQWSEPVNASTQANPKAKKDCFQRSIMFMISLIALTFISLIIIYFAAKKLSTHSLNLLYRYRQTKTVMPQRFEDVLNNGDNHSETGLKYWINRNPMEAMCLDSNLVYKFDARTNTIAEINSYNDEDHVQPPNEPDYVQTQPLTSQADQSPAGSIENMKNNRKESLSDMDDHSICSHSSFLANILNDKPHSGNNLQSTEMDN